MVPRKAAVREEVAVALQPRGSAGSEQRGAFYFASLPLDGVNGAVAAGALAPLAAAALRVRLWFTPAGGDTHVVTCVLEDGGNAGEQRDAQCCPLV